MAPVTLTHLAHVPAFVPPKARLPNSTRPADTEGLPELDGAVAACNELPRRNPVAVLDAAHVKSECIKAAEATLPPTELDEVRRTWRSNGRLLSWAHMAVAKGTIIKLHCHPQCTNQISRRFHRRDPCSNAWRCGSRAIWLARPCRGQEMTLGI